MHACMGAAVTWEHPVAINSVLTPPPPPPPCPARSEAARRHDAPHMPLPHHKQRSRHPQQHQQPDPQNPQRWWPVSAHSPGLGVGADTPVHTLTLGQAMAYALPWAASPRPPGLRSTTARPWPPHSQAGPRLSLQAIQAAGSDGSLHTCSVGWHFEGLGGWRCGDGCTTSTPGRGALPLRRPSRRSEGACHAPGYDARTPARRAPPVGSQQVGRCCGPGGQCARSGPCETGRGGTLPGPRSVRRLSAALCAHC